MAINYPNSLDNFTNPTSASPINSPSHSEQHANANDAIEAIEGELGTNPKGAKATVKARLDDVDTAIATKAPIASPTFTGTVTIPSGSAITGVPYLATANTFTASQIIQPTSTTAVGLIVKGAASQTANLQEWQNSAGTVLAKINAAGDFVGGGNTYIGAAYGQIMVRGANDYGAAVNINTGYFGTGGLYIRGAASQTANLQEWQNSNGTVLSKVQPGGEIQSLGFISSYNSYFYSGTSTAIPLRVLGAVSQTANLQEWQNSAGTVLSSITSAGDLNFASNLWNIKANGTNVIQWQPTLGSMFLSYGSSNPPITVQGSSGQTGDLTIWKNSSNVVLTKIDSSGALYLINPNPSANAGAITSPSINFQGSIWNNAYGSQTIKGAINVTEYLGNTNPTISKMSFLLATDNGTPAEVASFTNTGAFSNIGGLDAFGTNVIFRLRNTANATTLAHTPSPKLELMGRAWNSSEGSTPTRAYLQVNANNINSDPFINRLGFFVASGNNAGGWVYGADATEYMSILGNGRVGINSITPLATLDVRPTSASDKGILIRATSAHAANLIDFQNSAGTTVARVAENGQAMFPYYWDVFTQGETQGARIALRAQSASNPVAIFKGAGSQTANLQEWQDSAGTVLSSVSAAGLIRINNTNTDAMITATGNSTYDAFRFRNAGGLFLWGGGANNNIYYANSGTFALTGGSWVSGRLAVDTGSTSSIGIVVRGQASQTANLQEWQDSTGAIVAAMWSSGTFSTAGRVSIGNGSSGAKLDVLIASSTQLGLVVKGVASQTADLQQWQNSAGTVLASISPTGKLTSLVDGNFNGVRIGLGNSNVVTNLAVGYNALNANTTGDSNLAIGSNALYSNTTGFNNVALGQNTLVAATTANSSVAVGRYALSSVTTGSYNTGVGSASLNNTTTGQANIAIGVGTMYSNVSGGANVAIGNTALTSNTGSYLNVAIGDGAGYSATGAGNIFIGYNAGYNETGANKLYIANSNTSTPLIGGDFSVKTLSFAGNATITSQAAGTAALTLVAAASQTANLMETAGGFRISAGGNQLNSPGIYANYNFVATAGGAGVVAAIVKGAVSQTANLQQWQNSSGTTIVSINADGSSNFNNIMQIKEVWGGVGLSVSSLLGQSNPIQGWYTIDSNGDNKTEVAKIDIQGQLIAKSVIGNTSSTISANTATTVDTVAISSFTTIEYTISIKQGSKVRSSKVLVHTDGTSIDATEYGIMEMGGGITGILVTASVSSTNSILQVTITDAATTNATVKLIKTML